MKDKTKRPSKRDSKKENKKYPYKKRREEKKTLILKRLMKFFFNIWFFNMLFWITIVILISKTDFVEWKVTWLLISLIGYNITTKFWFDSLE